MRLAALGLLVLVLAGCGGAQHDATQASAPPTAVTNPHTIKNPSNPSNWLEAAAEGRTVTERREATVHFTISAKGRSAEIASALRGLQTEAERSQAKLCHKLGAANVLNTMTLVDPGPPPKGVSAIEWRAAVKHDGALQGFNCPTK